jgi:hypothetical protein
MVTYIFFPSLPPALLQDDTFLDLFTAKLLNIQKMDLLTPDVNVISTPEYNKKGGGRRNTPHSISPGSGDDDNYYFFRNSNNNKINNKNGLYIPSTFSHYEPKIFQKNTRSLSTGRHLNPPASSYQRFLEMKDNDSVKYRSSNPFSSSSFLNPPPITVTAPTLFVSSPSSSSTHATTTSALSLPPSLPFSTPSKIKTGDLKINSLPHNRELERRIHHKDLDEERKGYQQQRRDKEFGGDRRADDGGKRNINNDDGGLMKETDFISMLMLKTGQIQIAKRNSKKKEEEKKEEEEEEKKKKKKEKKENETENETKNGGKIYDGVDVKHLKIMQRKK